MLDVDEKTQALGITDSQLAAMMEAGLRANLTLHKAEEKDGESQVLDHIIDSSSFFESSTIS